MSDVWAPPWAPHVEGQVEDLGDGEKRVKGRCAACGEEFQRTCTSGMPREWIARFARAHLHRNPLG